MLPFDKNNATSYEADCLNAIASLLSYSSSVQTLAERNSPADTAQRIFVGPLDEPLDYVTFTTAELAEKFFFIKVAPVLEAGQEVLKPESEGGCPVQGGEATVYLRRYVRKIEVEAHGKNNIFMFFLDLISSAATQLVELAQSNSVVRITNVTREFGPAYGDLAAEAGQDEYIWAMLNVTWGDRDLIGRS